MPNHVENVVRMRNIGTRKELFRETEDGDVNLDFEKIIPMPDSLLDVSAPMQDYSVDLAMKALFMRLAAMPLYGYNGVYREFLNKLQTVKLDKPSFYEGKEVDALKEGLQYIINIVSYGYPDWYDWCVNYWGTKWNSYWGKIISDNMIQFVTAWDILGQIYIALSEKYPYDEIIVDWFNEGGIFGQTRYLDGEQIEEKVYKYSGDWEEEENKLFRKVELIEHAGKF